MNKTVLIFPLAAIIAIIAHGIKSTTFIQANCKITNNFHDEIEIRKSTKIYYVQPGDSTLFSCGDKVEISSGKYKTQMILNNSVFFEDTTVSPSPASASQDL